MLKEKSNREKKNSGLLLWGMFLFVLQVFFVQPAINCYFSDFEKNTEVSEMMDEQDFGEDDVEDNDVKDEKYHQKHHFKANNKSLNNEKNGLFQYSYNYSEIALEVPNLPPKLFFC